MDVYGILLLGWREGGGEGAGVVFWDKGKGAIVWEYD